MKNRLSWVSCIMHAGLDQGEEELLSAYCKFLIYLFRFSDLSISYRNNVVNKISAEPLYLVS